MTKKYILPFYRIKKNKDKILLITDQGSWAVLSRNKYKELLRYELSEQIIEQLEQKGIILTEKNTHIFINQEILRKKFLVHPPSLHIIIPTLRCNHQCIYCHSSAEQDQKKGCDLNEETAKEIVDFIMQSPSKKIKIEFQGGDGLLNFPILKYIIKYSQNKIKESEKDLMITLVTNLTLMTDEQIKYLREKKVSITTSLDGPKEIHDNNRKYLGGQGTYDDVITKIKTCRENNIRVGALMVTTRKSLEKAEEIVDEYIERGFTGIQLKFLNKIGFAEKDWKNVGYTPEEYLDFWKKSMEYIIQKNKEGINIVERFTTLLLKKIIKGIEPGFLDLRSPCGIALGQIAYNYNGDIYSCDEGRGFEIFNLGNVKQISFKEYANSKPVHKLIESSILETTYCDTCIYKPYCGTCPVLNYAEQKSLIAKNATNYRCKILKGQFDWIFEKIINEPETRTIFSKWIEKN